MTTASGNVEGAALVVGVAGVDVVPDGEPVVDPALDPGSGEGVVPEQPASNTDTTTRLAQREVTGDFTAPS